MIAVSGGSGFVGSQLVRTFVGRGPVISIGTGSALEQHGNILEVGCDHPDISSLLQPVTIFINAAGRLRGSWAELESANVTSIRLFLEALPPTLERAIHFSSVNVFFQKANDYGRAKALGEALWQASPFAGRLTILRPTWIYGPGDEHNAYRLIRQVQRFPVLPVPAAARMRPVYIEDTIELVLALIGERRFLGEAMVVSGREEVTFQELVEMLAALLGMRRRCLPIPAGLLTPFQKASQGIGLGRLAQRLESFQLAKTWHDASVWECLPRDTTPLEEGLRKCVESYLKSRMKE